MSKNGYIYCLSNPSYEGLYKIGFTTRNVEDRIKELHTTGVIYPFKIELVKWVTNCEKKERLLHKICDRYGERKVKNREFFSISINEIKDLFDLIDEEYKKEKSEEIQKEVPKKKRGRRLMGSNRNPNIFVNPQGCAWLSREPHDIGSLPEQSFHEADAAKARAENLEQEELARIEARGREGERCEEEYREKKMFYTGEERRILNSYANKHWPTEWQEAARKPTGDNKQRKMLQDRAYYSINVIENKSLSAYDKSNNSFIKQDTREETLNFRFEYR